MLFTMLSGEVPPGSLRVTPAVERLVQRALDTDVSRRYQTANVMLENLLEAMEDDRWELADRGELIKEAGLSATDENIDDATEDLLASLSKGPMHVTNPRPSGDIRAEMTKPQPTTGARLEALLSNLGDETGLTQVDEAPSKFRRDPISDIIRSNPRQGEAIVSSARVPSLDDPDEDEPPQQRRTPVPARPNSSDEAAALAALDGLDEPARRMSTAAEQAAAAAKKLEEAAARAERAAHRAESEPPVRPTPRPARPLVEPIPEMDVPTPTLRSPVKSAIGGLVILGILGGGGYVVYNKYNQDEARAAQAKKDQAQREAEKQALEAKLRNAQPDSGAIEVTSDGAGIWLRLGRTPLDAPIHLSAAQPHDMVLLHAGNEPTEAQVNGTHWTGAKETLKAKIDVKLKPSKSKEAPEIPLQPTTAVLGSTGVVGAGLVHVDSTPSDAEVWLFIGANHAQFNELWAGRDYEVAVVKPGFKTKHVEFKAEEWRDGGDPNMPIDVAKKKPLLSKTVDLEPDADASKGSKKK
jgi:hypothetical protein